MFTCTNSGCTTEPAWVQYCLAQPVGNPQLQCTVSISTNILVAVIICNCVKALCFLVTLFASDFQPLATVGDAIESFMDRTDPVTTCWGPISIFDVVQISNHSEVFGTIGGCPSMPDSEDFQESVNIQIVSQRFCHSHRTWEHRSRRWSSSLSSLFPIFALLL